jgi:hypothetical protein
MEQFFRSIWLDEKGQDIADCPVSAGNGERSFAKIAERTYEKRAQALHRRRESSHPEATPLSTNSHATY